MIAKSNHRTLFVAAGGNGGNFWNDPAECKVWPACLTNYRSPSSDRILSVVALDGMGKDLVQCPFTQSDGTTALRLGTNYGEDFEVAAVGVGLSSVVGNAFGRMCGTSVAAPYVSALASLIYSKAGEIDPGPQAVKERILATADMTDLLRGKVKFGRINFANALAYNRDLFVTATVQCMLGPSCPIEIANRRTTTLKVASAIEGNVELTDIVLPLSEIRRISRASNDGRFRIIRHEKGHPDLDIYDEVEFAADAVLTEKSQGTVGVIHANEIVDFIPCSAAIMHPDNSSVEEGECDWK
jgi:hypothetical protein